MDKTYADTVRLLLAVTPAVFSGDIFAMKGGTAINLFKQDMPRLSVDIEVNTVFRGTLLPVEQRPLTARTSNLVGVEFETPILARDGLYAGKLVAALDRQHPRDLFDVCQLYESGGLSDGMAECFVIDLAGHNRPPHEVLFGSDKDIAAEYGRAFVRMTEVDCSLEVLLEARARLPPYATSRHCFCKGFFISRRQVAAVRATK